MAHVKAVVHTHSVKAIKYTRRDAAVQALMTLNISRLTKGIWNRANCREYEEGEICTIPIGTDHELIDRLHDALKSNPSSCSVLVRDHGLFVFADTWRKAKKECEIIEQQFELEV
ncbi:probable methylthioribulose-1-phosphate dehydratase [Sitodiplosis mosellana]|uniref:probable methylthioribulose-1-phosphate dehydratase n=1 Tax=Sitodiplosis mosellana TaxID=263140 RepID=UPI002443C121|nr:probable methylthioribulose-1-phosphate dehydratase [Sitodiplosis mosellana]